MCSRLIAITLVCCPACTMCADADDSPRWAGEGGYRLIVEVAAVTLKGRTKDEMPADIEVDLARLLKDIGVTARPNLAWLQVMKIDRKSGEPVEYDDFAYGRSPYDRPFFWYDAAIPYEFPEVFRPSSYSDGERIRQISRRAGYMYPAIGDWKRGHLAFAHTQHGAEASRYTIYFDVLSDGRQPSEVPPRGWLGDGLPRRDLVGDSTTGSDATKITLDDYDGDGLVDIVYGEQYGQLFVMPNRGIREKPEFPCTKMLFEADGHPLDVGIHAAALVVDWDADGAKDILAGTYQNSIAFFKNIGNNRQRRYDYRGFVNTADGDVLALPITPVAEKPEGIFKHDYYPVLSSVDWNNDGRPDIIAGTDSHKVSVFLNTGGTGDKLFAEPLPLKLPQIKEIRVRAVDLSRDGDQDLFVMSTQGSILVERSFLEHGYARGRVVKMESQTGPSSIPGEPKR